MYLLVKEIHRESCEGGGYITLTRHSGNKIHCFGFHQAQSFNIIFMPNYPIALYIKSAENMSFLRNGDNELNSVILSVLRMRLIC